MEYRYTYKDWEEGKIIWNSIESNKYEDNYISESCKAKIKQKQKEIFEEESSLLLETHFKLYNLNRRADTNRNNTVNKLLQTIDNLFNISVETLEDTIILDEKQAMTESIPIEYKNKVIPPLNWTQFNKMDIIEIQNVFLSFTTTRKWNYGVIETPIKDELLKYVDFRRSLFAKTYYDFFKRLRQFDGIISNTFQSDISHYDLTNLRSDLIKRNFIDKKTDRDLFVKSFQGYYLMKNEHIYWLKNLDILHYFIKSFGKKLTHQKPYGKWEIASNCFAKNNSNIKPSTLRRATKINDYPTEKKKIDSILAKLI